MVLERFARQDAFVIVTGVAEQEKVLRHAVGIVAGAVIEITDHVADGDQIWDAAVELVEGLGLGDDKRTQSLTLAPGRQFIGGVFELCGGHDDVIRVDGCATDVLIGDGKCGAGTYETGLSHEGAAGGVAVAHQMVGAGLGDAEPGRGLGVGHIQDHRRC